MVNCSAFLSSDSWAVFAHMPPPGKGHRKRWEKKKCEGVLDDIAVFI